MRRWLGLLLVAAAGFGPAIAAAEPPARVVSINLCTDELALMLAAPGQLVSVSWLSHDPRVSALAERARAIPANRGQAEEVVLLEPDLVLAGRYTTRAAVALLRRLGVRVETFDPAVSLDEIRARVRRMGEVLGREAAAAALLADFDRRLTALAPAGGPRPRVALLHPNGYTSGAGTLADAIVRAAGFRNLASELGLSGVVRLGLERLVMAAPEVVLVDPPQGGPALAEAVLAHPALRALEGRSRRAVMDSRLGVCGTPLVAEAVEALAALRAQIVRRGGS